MSTSIFSKFINSIADDVRDEVTPGITILVERAEAAALAAEAALATINQIISDFNGTPPPAPVLNSLSLSSNTIEENSPAGTIVGLISGRSIGSILTLTDSAGNRFAISGNNIVAGVTPTNFDAITSHSITIRETLVGATHSPRDTVIIINVTNVLEGPILSALTLPESVGEGETISIIGATAGSTITGTLPLDWTLDSEARTITVGTVGEDIAWELTETFPDSNPRTSTGTITVTTIVTPTGTVLERNIDGTVTIISLDGTWESVLTRNSGNTVTVYTV